MTVSMYKVTWLPSPRGILYCYCHLTNFLVGNYKSVIILFSKLEQKHPYPPHEWSLAKPRGWGTLKAIIFKGKYEANWTFQKGGSS